MTISFIFQTLKLGQIIKHFFDLSVYLHRLQGSFVPGDLILDSSLFFHLLRGSVSLHQFLIDKSSSLFENQAHISSLKPR